MEKFSYKKSQFDEIIACICRPGLGIISDCIEYNIKLFTVFEKNNFEMHHNSQILNKLGIGKNIEIKNFSPLKITLLIMNI